MDRPKIIKVLVLILILTCAAISGYRWYSNHYGGQITATGTVEATTVKINAKTAGTVNRMLFLEGDQIKAGQVAAEMGRNDLAAQREQSAMAVSVAEAKWKDLTNGPRSQELTAAAAAVEQARINVNQAETDLVRAQSLSAQGAVPAQTLEQAQNTVGLRQEQLRAAQAQMQNLQAGSREQAVAAAWAEMERTKAVLKASDALLADLKLTSPINGTILQRYFEPGEYVSMGAALYQVADLNSLWVKVYIPTNQLPVIKVGSKVKCTVSGSHQIFSGQVEHINSQGEYTPKAIQTKNERANVVFGVKIKLANSKGILKPGMPIDVEFAGDDK
ncbi:MAG: HlyD family secretion protein [Methylocystaceae bacterium]